MIQSPDQSGDQIGDPSGSQAAWFLAQFKPNSHAVAVKNLARQGFCTFLPLQSETCRAQDGFVARLRPLFPGYLFVALDLAQGQGRAVNSTYGLTGLVRFGTTPQPVPHALVDQLVARCDPDGCLLPPDDLEAGARVKVTTGPFAEFVATIERLAPDRRVWVLLECLGQQTRVAVPRAGLRLA